MKHSLRVFRTLVPARYSARLPRRVQPWKAAATATACALALAASALPGYGTILLQDSFNSTPGPLVGTVPEVGGIWTAINPSTDEIQVVSGSLTAPTGMVPSTGNRISWGNAGEDALCGFASQNSGTVYYSFLINLTNNSSSLSGGNIMSLSGPNGLVASLSIRRDASDSSKYNIGYYETATFNGPHWTSAQLAPGTSHFVVIGYQFVAGSANDVVSLWRNVVMVPLNKPIVGSGNGTNDRPYPPAGTPLWNN